MTSERSGSTLCRRYPEHGGEESSMLAAQLAVAAAFTASSHWVVGDEEKLADEMTLRTLKDALGEGPATTIILSRGLDESLGESFPGLRGEDVFRVAIEDLAHYIATCTDKSINNVACVVLNRARNQEMVRHLREIGVQVVLVNDVDPKSTLMLEDEEKPVDFAIGVGPPVKDSHIK